MRYEPPLFRPPSEASSYLLQATIGCSWNNCTYCQMYRTKAFRIRPLRDTLEDIRLAATRLGRSSPIEPWRPQRAANTSDGGGSEAGN